jgi:transposase
VALVAKLQHQVVVLQEQVAELAASLAVLRAENAQLQRSAKRQAAPFSRGTRAQAPKRPGRKPGQGTFTFRQAPSPEEITEPPVDVPVTLESCPGCGAGWWKSGSTLRPSSGQASLTSPTFLHCPGLK